MTMQIALACLLTIGANGEGSSWTYRDIPKWPEAGTKDSNECDSVGTQSPIDIVTSVTKSETMKALQLLPAESDKRLLWDKTCGEHVEQFTNAHTWEIEFPSHPGGICERIETNDAYPHVMWNGKKYFLKQFHYHSPSEHTFDKKFTEMEAHHVHVASDGQALVIAVQLIVSSDENKYMAQFWSGFPADTKVKAPSTKMPLWKSFIPYSDDALGTSPRFFPSFGSYFHYMGSFTTPQCTTNTVWILMKDPVSMGQFQLDAYRKAMGALPADVSQLTLRADVPGFTSGTKTVWDTAIGVNNRPVQLLGARAVSFYEDPTLDVSDVLGILAKFLAAGAAVYIGSILCSCCCCGLLIWCLCKICCGGDDHGYHKGSDSDSDSGSSSSSSSDSSSG